jgi:hypothetical protein
LLTAVTLYYRPQFPAKSASDLKSHLVSWVVCVDILLATALTMYLGRDQLTLVGYFAVCAGAGIFGGYLYAVFVCRSVDLAARSEFDEEPPAAPLPPEPAVGTGPTDTEAFQIGPTAVTALQAEFPPTPGERDLRRKSMPAVRVFVTCLLLLPLMMLFGFGQSWEITFVIALVSFGAGRLVEMLVIQARDS